MPGNKIGANDCATVFVTFCLFFTFFCVFSTSFPCSFLLLFSLLSPASATSPSSSSSTSSFSSSSSSSSSFSSSYSYSRIQCLFPQKSSFFELLGRTFLGFTVNEITTFVRVLLKVFCACDVYVNFTLPFVFPFSK